ncbi:spore germination protein (plasmid) [Bacillus sp. CMF21]|nr:spore germination protein [Bacillus sp. CMF21]
MDKSLCVVLMYILIHLGLIFFLYPGNIIESTDAGHWIPISIGVSIHFIVIFLYMKGLSYFPNEDIITIFLRAGKGIAIVFLVPVALYFLVINIITIRAYSEVVTIVFLSKTPLWAVMALLLSISSYLTIKGVEAIFRTGVLLALLFLPLIFFILVVSFQNVDWYYVYPIWNKQFSFITKPSYLNSFFAVGGGFLFLGFVQPFFSYQRKKILLAAIVIIPCFFISVYIPILTFGQATASKFLLPFVMAIDGINLNWLMFDRVTMFFLMSLITFIMLFISLVLWKMVRIVHTCIPSIKPHYLVIALSGLIYIICLSIPNWNDIERLFIWNTFLRFYVMSAVPISILYLGIRSRKERQNGTA